MKDTASSVKVELRHHNLTRGGHTGVATGFDKSLAGTYTVTAASGLNVRNAAGTNNKVLVAIPKGTKVQNYGYYTLVGGVKWLYVKFTYNGVTYIGFASASYLKK